MGLKHVTQGQEALAQNRAPTDIYPEQGLVVAPGAQFPHLKKKMNYEALSPGAGQGRRSHRRELSNLEVPQRSQTSDSLLPLSPSSICPFS